MQEDFHYYATYCAANIAGFSPEESTKLAFSANFVDLCSATFLKRIKAPQQAATTQLNMEMADTKTNLYGIQGITRVWSAFHFLPFDLYADPGHGIKLYKNKYRLICKPNGALVKDTIDRAKGRGLQAAGIAMHVLADTWAHMNFAGTPSLVINNISGDVFELFKKEDGYTEKKIKFRHALSGSDDLENSVYTSSIFQSSETAVMNLGHGRAGHMPDYSFLRYKYMPAWADYEEVIKDNPSDYMHAFAQMVCALKYLHGDADSFETGVYDWEAIEEYKEEIKTILEKRQLIACDDWKLLGKKIAGVELESFERDRHQGEYIDAPEGEKEKTFLGRFITEAMAHKKMIADKITGSGNKLAGVVRK